VKNVIGGVCYVSGFIMVKLYAESYWYHMHVEVSKNIACTWKLVKVSYFDMWIGEYMHWCDLVNVVLMWIVDSYMLIDMLWWWCDNVHAEFYVEYVLAYLFEILECFNWLCLFFEYYLTPSGRSVDHRVISLNDVGELQDCGDCLSLMLED